MALTTTIERRVFPLDVPFEIARDEATEDSETVIVRVADDDGRTGLGAAVPAAYYDETPDTVVDALHSLLSVVETVGDPHAQQEIAARMREITGDDAAARAAVSIALHDLAAKQADEPLYRRWGLDPAAAPRTSYSIGIADPVTMAERAAAARDRGFPILKCKVGTDDDRARLDAIREAVPDVRLRVDANCAWDADEAIMHTQWLAEFGVEFVEQPVAGDDLEGLARVADASPVPIAADESCVTAKDVPGVADAADVVVVKLMKCGGIRAARDQIAAAHAHNLDVMLGCMVEPNAAIAASHHLAPLVEYADLDGSLLLADDPFDGVPLRDGVVDLREVERPGTGAVER
ncbi:dipeptide epimerase [Halobacteriales archaeon Cl-PHB]